MVVFLKILKRQKKGMTRFLLFTISLMLINCEKNQWGQKIPADVKVISVKEIYDKFKEYRGKKVLMEGRTYKAFPGDVFLNDGTGNIKVEFQGETSLFKEKISWIGMNPDPQVLLSRLQKMKFVRVFGVVDVDRDYPLGSMLLGASPIITASGIELQ
ncbi:MAG: hypothetical protein ABIK93_01535 [candidate division WOR-3 bacterium]